MSKLCYAVEGVLSDKLPTYKKLSG
jgi:hypothetical protein